ncbi:CapA family protein [Clostridium saccharobutylicum]|uniref:PGA biosynthesis protein CapA n=1 Tax=Clostridium saccharobutylicum DSM 13864 TaxID=1345695 RepID=U5MLC0_CLOSA|nr:CapA family protein [Clostridium saccharobutylicum]AGX41328.1 PGA biosynthesis protein CapA [Clostridium saccharobutylicum DSM 13864]AQR88614.1 capsule biosynthesis protein CapA [Clostridium saccharobutylicum]AQR98512.1 capsule biosynthesis protein CapA [Clostridium saccharobutylicum]AQS08224.1 capsule biosynthesis protein CapA [Clostridium saccharobutylicum]AQS12502.1 capsule biosynthesis protein CapA [Clostridium saccharobutylicum]
MRKRASRKRRNRYKNNLGKIFLAIMFIGVIIISMFIFINRVFSVKEEKNVAQEIENPAKVENKAEEEIKEPVRKEILISFAGDFTLGTDDKFAYDSSLPAAFINNGSDYSYFMQNVSSIFGQDDYTLVNLETTLTDSDIKAQKEGNVVYNFKGPKEYVNILNNASIEGVTIANNHIYDYGTQGVQDTIGTLQQNNIDICGEGYKILKQIKGVKFGFLGYTGWNNSDNFRNAIINDISELKKQGADVVIPYFHWGMENDYEPDYNQQSIARFAIDNGADCVIGSHPHVLQSMENYNGKLIAYSLGNFCFGGNSNPSDKRTVILQLKVDIEGNKIENFEYKVIPTMISSRSDTNDYIPTPATDEDKNNILKTLNELSPSLNGNIKDDFFYIQ